MIKLIMAMMTPSWTRTKRLQMQSSLMPFTTMSQTLCFLSRMSRWGASCWTRHVQHHVHFRLRFTDPNKQITTLLNYVWHILTICATLAEKASNEDLNNEVLVHAMQMCWNTVMLLLEHALDLCEVLSELCNMAQFNYLPGCCAST